ETGPGTASDAAAHDGLIAALGDSLQKDQSADPRVIVYYALASARRAVELRRADQTAPARHVLDRARQQIDAGAGGAADRDPQALYRAAEGLTILADAYQQLDEPAETPAAPTPAAAATTRPASATTKPAAAPSRAMWPT